MYPALKPLYPFEFENTYDPDPLLYSMADNNYVIPVACVVAYLLFCYFGQIIMKDKPAFDLTNSLAAWNLFLSVFSAYGAFRTVPHLLWRVTSFTFEETVCDAPHYAYGAGACGLASFLFIVSKIPELIDTVFIVLRKKPLIFLHWYHHVTVLLFCWNSYTTQSGAGLYFIAMNYTVHAVMYFYFFMQSIRAVPKWFPSWLITMMQISQMIVGTTVVSASLYFHFYGGEKYPVTACNNSPSTLIAGALMYGSYLYLFVEFAVKRFLFGASDEKPKKKAAHKEL